MHPNYVRALMLHGDLPDMAQLLHRPAWQALAACRASDPNVFVLKLGQSSEEAKAVCAGCAVTEACLDFALADDQLAGVWGGTSAGERKSMRRVSA
jgi:WhiB family redox-sensing transcriptional regulator